MTAAGTAGVWSRNEVALHPGSCEGDDEVRRCLAGTRPPLKPPVPSAPLHSMLTSSWAVLGTEWCLSVSYIKSFRPEHCRCRKTKELGGRLKGMKYACLLRQKKADIVVFGMGLRLIPGFPVSRPRGPVCSTVCWFPCSEVPHSAHQLIASFSRCVSTGKSVNYGAD